MGKSTAKRMWHTAYYVVCLVAAVAFVGYHLYSLVYSDIVTLRAENKHFKDTSSYVGYVARDEQTVPAPEGALLFLGENAARFKQGDDCAYVYSSYMSEKLEEIKKLEEQNAILSSALYYNTLSQSDADADLYYKELMSKLSLGNASVSQSADSLVSAQLSKDFVFDRAALREAKENNEKRIEELKNSLGNYSSSVKMPSTGYFFRGGDAFGQLFGATLAEMGSADDIFSAIDEYSATENDENSEKLFTVTRFGEWYLLVETTPEDSNRYVKGNDYTLLLGKNETESKAHLDDIRTSFDGKRTCLVFSLASPVSKLETERCLGVKIVTAEYDGYRIPFSALRNDKNGVSGVYVMSGGVVIFKRVEMVKVTDSYVLVRSYESYLAELEKNRSASKIYNSRYEDSLFTGIYPGGVYSTFEDRNKIFGSPDNVSLNVKGIEQDTSVNLAAALEKNEYGYLEENELVIIKGSSLYHGRISG